MTIQVVAKATNRSSLVIGEISDKEAEYAAEMSPMIDGVGVYLVSVDKDSPNGFGEVLAKFVSEDAARELARFFRLTGTLEAA